MFSLKKFIKKITKTKKNDSPNLTLKTENKIYGSELLCARYYYSKNDWIDVYVPLKGPVGIWMSGGSDSTLLAYLIAKTIKDYNLDLKILPITYKRKYKNWNYAVATNVVEQIKKILDVDCFLNHNYCFFNHDGIGDKLVHNEKMKKHIKKLKENFIVTLVYKGDTMFPDPIPEEFGVSEEDKPLGFNIENKDEDAIEEYVLSLPFIFVDKKATSTLYNKLNLEFDLLPYTYSCDSSMEKTDFFRIPCEKCWKCKRREWSLSQFNFVKPHEFIGPSRKLKRECETL